jgi:NADH:ubiquinone oxidoreductase subunit 4 (subunit M)
MLNALLLIPIIGTLVILPMSEEKNSTLIKQIGLIRSLLNFIL